MTLEATTAAAPARRALVVRRHTWAGLAAMVGLVLLAVAMAQTSSELAPLWLLAAVAGFALQRSRLCFASAFRDVFLFGRSHVMRGILVGLAVGTIGFAIVMMGEVPFARMGALPREAHVLPAGLSTVVGGLLFGFGMVLAGGCVSGSLYRSAEGYVGSWVTIAGVIAGLGLLAHTWNWWWEVLISREPTVWLARSLGYGAAVALTLAALFGVWLILLWWEGRSALPTVTREETDHSAVHESGPVSEQIAAVWGRVFVRGWSPVAGGAVLGVVGVLMYVVHMPFGVTGELSRWGNRLMGGMGAAPPTQAGLADLGGCTGRAMETGLFTHTFTTTVGVLGGALVAALLSGEFKVRVPRRPRRYVQSMGGGLLMGYGAGLAIGCTIGAFFSAIPSLALSGWLFAVALLAGAFLGSRVIQRL